MFLWYKRSVPILCSIQIISNGPPSERQGQWLCIFLIWASATSTLQIQSCATQRHPQCLPHVPLFLCCYSEYPASYTLSKDKMPTKRLSRRQMLESLKKTSNTCCPSCLLWKILPFRPPKKFELNSAGHSLPPTDWHKLQLTNDIKRRWKFVGTQLLVHLIQSRRPSPSLEHQWPGPSPSSLVGCWKSRTNLSHEKPSRHNELQEKHKNYNN